MRHQARGANGRRSPNPSAAKSTLADPADRSGRSAESLDRPLPALHLRSCARAALPRSHASDGARDLGLLPPAQMQVRPLA